MDMVLALALTVVLAVGAGCHARTSGGCGTPGEPRTAAATVNAYHPASWPAGCVVNASPDSADSNGPTIRLSYSQESLHRNPTPSFMYFIVLISPVSVTRQISPENHQEAGIVSYKKETRVRSFSVACEFKMSGDGFCRFAFDRAEMTAYRLARSKKPRGEDLTKLLDYINFEGEGRGVVRVKGVIDHSVQTVTEVELEFISGGGRSPVTIGLYDLKYRDGQYRYENRTNQIVARVNSLVFRKTQDPRVDITVASIARTAESNGFFARLKAAVANLFLKPVRITVLGNETMLRFGGALAAQQPTFTFPKAANMGATTVLAGGPRKK
jgi:hypothetical protein